MWIGTQDGVNRYDGYSFDSFKSDPDDSTTIQPGFVGDIIEDSQGDVWIASNQGLSRHDALTDGFERFVINEDIWEVAEGEPGVIWMAAINSGLKKLDVESGSITGSDELFDGLFKFKPITSLETQSNGDLWIGTADSGLYIADANTQTVRHYPSGENGLGPGPILSIYEDSNQSMWVGAWGLNRWNPDSENFENALPNPELRLKGRRSLKSNENLVTAILEDDNESLWVGMGFGHGTPEGGGIAEFDKEKKTFYRYRNDPSNANTLRNDNVFALEKDRNGNVWVGTATEGVSRFDAMPKPFSLYSNTPSSEFPYLRGGSARGVTIDRDGVLWIVMTDGVLNRIDRENGSHDYFELGQNLMYIMQEKGGLLMAGNGQGYGLLFDPVTKRITKKLNPKTRRGGLFQTRNGDIYRGLDLYDSESQEFLKSDSEIEFLRIQHEDEDGVLWFSAHQGLLGNFNPQSGETQSFDGVRPGRAMIVRKQEPGVLWIADVGGGLRRHDTHSGESKRYSEQNSDLNNNTLYSIFDDEEGHLWMSSNDGIIKFEPETETFHSFGVGNGLQSQEFDSGSEYKSPEGEIFFGGANGVNSFYPHLVEVDPVVPDVVLTEVRLFNQKLKAGPDSPIDVPINELQTLKLDHNENDLTFEYVGIQFDRPEKNQYAYKLDNYDADWRFVGDQRRATYTSLDPGSYSFNVKSANADGVWNDDPISFDVTISPPWWRTIWAYLLFGMTLLLSGIGVDRFQRARVIQVERGKAELTAKELRARAAEATADLLKSENRRQTQELDSARELQLSMLPAKVPELSQLRIKTFMKTAVEVGGDYYDFELDEEGTLTCAIGDATGHGTRAGTMVTATKSLWNAYSREKDLASILRKSHKALRKLGLPSLYMSLALARIKDNTLELVGAGLPDALIFRARTGKVESFSLKGIPLGGPHDMPFSSVTTKFETGDTLLLMTDGFAELFNEQGEMLGYEEAVLKFRALASKSVEEIVAGLEAEGIAWSGSRPVDDDITFLVIKYI